MANLTPSSQGLRWRRKDWEAGRWVKVNRVSDGPIRTVNARDQNGEKVIFMTNALETDWIIHEDVPQV